jgi:hypothetical protein
MGVPTSEVGYTIATTRRETTKVHKNMWWQWGEDIKGKAVPLQAWSDPEGSKKLKFPDYMTTAQDGGKIVSLTYRPLLPPGNAPGTHFC